MATTITPEQRLRNVAACVIRKTTPSRVNIGKRPDNFQASNQEIADAARQLAEEIQLYLDGKLAPIDSELPF